MTRTTMRSRPHWHLVKCAVKSIRQSHCELTSDDNDTIFVQDPTRALSQDYHAEIQLLLHPRSKVFLYILCVRLVLLQYPLALDGSLYLGGES